MSSGVMVALAPCWSCKKVFMFDPDKVPSIPICQECHRPPDLHAEDCTQTAELVREPLCRECIEMINANKRRQGEPEVHVMVGAYPEVED